MLGKKRRVDEIKTELYSRKKNGFFNHRKELKKKKFSKLKNSWSDETKNLEKDNDLYQYKKNGPSFFKVTFIIALGFFIASIAFAFFYLSFNKNSVKNEIELLLIGPDSARSGEVVEFFVKLKNPSKVDYREIELLVDFPESTINVETDSFVSREEILMPKKLLAGGEISKKFAITLSGFEGEKRDIKIAVYYKAGNFSNLLSSKRIYTIKIESAPVSIEMNYPKKVLSKKEFEFTADLLSNSKKDLYDLVIIAKYPAGFKVISSEPEAVFSNITQNVFKIKKLSPGEKKSIKIQGILLGENNENKYFSFEVGDSVPFTNELRTSFAKTESEIAIKKPDLDLVIKGGRYDDEGNIIVYAGEDLDLSLFLNNELDSIISNLKIKAKLSGDILEKRKVNVPGGFYNSIENTILWDKTTDLKMENLKARTSIKEKLSLEILPLEKIAGYIKDPELKINFDIFGTNFNDENSDGKIVEQFQKKIKVATDVILESDIYYNDGPFKNTGSLNPKVGQATTYTIVWKIYNSSSDISEVEVKTKLPPYVRFLNNISPKSAYISYNDATREVTWKYKKIDAFIGYRTDPKTVYFQVELTPTAPQIDSRPKILEKVSLTAKDLFTKLDIKKSVKGGSTALLNDSSYIYGSGLVKE